MTFDPTIYTAFGAVLVAIIAGAFSLLSVVSAKESKISEHRLTWINELRDEVSSFTSAIHELSKLYEIPIQAGFTKINHHEHSKEPYKIAVGSLTKIQLRLNPEDVGRNDSKESKLKSAIDEARAAFNADKYDEIVEKCDAIRSAAAPLLKAEWDRVKEGEKSYRYIRNISAIALGAIAIFISLFVFQLKTDTTPKPMQVEVSSKSIELQAKVELGRTQVCQPTINPIQRHIPKASSNCQ